MVEKWLICQEPLQNQDSLERGGKQHSAKEMDDAFQMSEKGAKETNKQMPKHKKENEERIMVCMSSSRKQLSFHPSCFYSFLPVFPFLCSQEVLQVLSFESKSLPWHACPDWPCTSGLTESKNTAGWGFLTSAWRAVPSFKGKPI